MAPLHRTTQQDTWERLSWGLPLARFLPTGVATGGRLIVMVASIIHIRQPTVAPIGVTVTIIQRLTMTTTRELMVGKRVPMVRMARRQQGRDTILTPGLMPGVLRFRRLTGVEVQRRRIIPIQEPMLRPDRARARTLS